MKRLGLVAFGLFLLAATADAFMPAGIEQVIRSWFSGAGKLVKFEIFPSAVSNPRADRCTVWMDRTTMNLMAGCDGATSTVVASGSALGCSVDASGNMTCNTFVSGDQNALSPVAANRFRVLDNDVDLTPNPTCADYGQAHTLTLLDVDESATDVYVICNGTTEAIGIGSTVPDCPVAGATHLTYDLATRAWGCD